MADMDRLLQKRMVRGQRSTHPLSTFQEKLRRANLLLRFAEKAKGKNSIRIKSEARRQFIISLVTALEVYLSDLALELIDRGKVGYGKELLDEIGKKKFTLSEVADILKHHVKLGELMCEQINFQNIAETYSFLSKLFRVRFPDYLSDHRFTYLSKAQSVVTISLRKSFSGKFAAVLAMRHSFVHDVTFNGTPSYKTVRAHEKLIRHVIVCIDVKADAYRGVTTSSIQKK